MKNKRGITLVSLVVTIVILIILAGVSINLTLGENGIITMAKKARENMELAKIDEERQLNELYEQIIAEGGVSGNISNEEISQLAEFKRKIASAITDMGIDTLETANADTMASNIRSISKEASSISYDNTSSGLTSTNVQGAVDELDTEIYKLDSSLNDMNQKSAYNAILNNNIKSGALSIGKKNGIISINVSIATDFNLEAWQEVEIGSVANWDNGQHEIMVSNLYGGTSYNNCIVKIYEDGKITLLTHGAQAIKEKWLLGNYTRII